MQGGLCSAMPYLASAHGCGLLCYYVKKKLCRFIVIFGSEKQHKFPRAMMSC